MTNFMIIFMSIAGCSERMRDKRLLHDKDRASCLLSVKLLFPKLPKVTWFELLESQLMLSTFRPFNTEFQVEPKNQSMNESIRKHVNIHR